MKKTLYFFGLVALLLGLMYLSSNVKAEEDKFSLAGLTPNEIVDKMTAIEQSEVRNWHFYEEQQLEANKNATKAREIKLEHCAEASNCQMNKCGKVTKKGWSGEASYWVQKAYEISDCDKTFVLLLEAENGNWDYKRQSDMIGANGYYDYGFCQINEGYFYDIVNDERFNDQEWQLGKCLELYRKGTTFYGLYRIDKIRNNIIFK